MNSSKDDGDNEFLCHCFLKEHLGLMKKIFCISPCCQHPTKSQNWATFIHAQRYKIGVRLFYAWIAANVILMDKSEIRLLQKLAATFFRCLWCDSVNFVGNLYIVIPMSHYSRVQNEKWRLIKRKDSTMHEVQKINRQTIWL